MRVEIEEILNKYYPSGLESWEWDYINSTKLIERKRTIHANKQLYKESFENLSLCFMETGLFTNPVNLTDFGSSDFSYGLILGSINIPNGYIELNHIIFISLLAKYYCFFHRVKDYNESKIIYSEHVQNIFHSVLIKHSIQKHFNEFVELPYPESMEILKNLTSENNLLGRCTIYECLFSTILF